MDLTPDPRSRFYDPYDPDCEPLPPDDPAAHRFMHCSDGKEGSKFWHHMGDTVTVENPAWLEPYAVLLSNGNTVDGHQHVNIPRVTLKDSIDLTYIHSREYQSQVEDVYLLALDLTQQRYLLNTRFSLTPQGVGGAFLGGIFPRHNNNTARLDTGLGVNQLLPGGAQFSVDILNSITWDLGQGKGSAPRLAWSITQPLLNGAGRKVVMENLTQSERNLLYEVRNLARFRQTLFTDVASDYLSLQQTTQIIINSENNIRQLEEQIEIARAEDDRKPRETSVQLIQGAQELVIPDALSNKVKYDGTWLKWIGDMSDQEQEALLAVSDNNAFQRAAQELIQFRATQAESLRVLQLVTRLNRAQNTLEGTRRQLADRLDSFKIRLGLPPNVQMTVDDRFLMPFELIDSDLLSLTDDLKDFQKAEGPALLPDVAGADPNNATAPAYDILRQYVSGLVQLKNRVREAALDRVKEDFVPVRDILSQTDESGVVVASGQRAFNTTEERDRVIREIARDLRTYRVNEQMFEPMSEALDVFQKLLEAEDVDALVKLLDKNANGVIERSEMPIVWNSLPRMSFVDTPEMTSGPEFLSMIRDACVLMWEQLRKVAQSQQVVQAGLRVEAIALNQFRLFGTEELPDIEEVVQIGLQNRHDLMNARAAVMDARRKVEVAANALMSRLDVDVAGTVDPDGGNNDQTSVSLDFKAPLDQIAERNAYNRQLISYQRARRTYMSLEDGVKQNIRSSWRQLMVARERLEIDRQTVRNAAKEYDNVVTGGGQNNSLSLLNALDSVLQAQNSLVGDWISYETNRLNIFRDMGIMQIDSDGIWEDEFYQNGDQLTSEDMPAPADLFPQLQSDQTPSPSVPADVLPPEIPSNE